MPKAIPLSPPPARVARSSKNKNNPRNPFEILFAGFVAGAISRTCTAPMDRLRSLMAAGGTSTLAQAEGTSILSGLRSMYAAGGIRCMWQGNAANVVQVGPESAILFFTNDIFTSIVQKDKEKPLPMVQKFGCGALAGIVSMTLVYPMYVVQNRMMVAREGLYSSIYDCIKQTYRQEGLSAFAQGYKPSLVRIVPYKGIDMAGYTMLREYFVERDEIPTTIQSLSFGATASAISQTVTHPLLLARTKLQCQGAAMGRPIKYHGMFDAIMTTFQKGCADHFRNGTRVRGYLAGIKMLWSGWAPSMVKNVPAIAIQFAVYEKTLEAVDFAKERGAWS